MTVTSPDGVLAPDRSPLIEDSILPTSLDQRPIGAWGYAWIWVGIAVIIATYSLGATGVQGGVSLGEVILTIFLANLVLGAFMLLTADIGTEHGLSFAVYLRAPFGIHGTHLPSLSRGLVAAMWFGIQTYLGAIALNGIVEYFLGFDNWVRLVRALRHRPGRQHGGRHQGGREARRDRRAGDHRDLDLDVLHARRHRRHQGPQHLELPGDRRNVAARALRRQPRLLVDDGDRHPEPHPLREDRARRHAVSSPRNRNVFAGQLIALPLTQAVIAGIGAVSWIATGNWNPIEVIQADAQGLALLALLALVVLAQWSTNNCREPHPRGAHLRQRRAAAHRLPDRRRARRRRRHALLPWAILDNLFAFLGYYGAFLSAIGGIMIADYYLIRRRRLNVPDLYRLDGQFRYAGGFNPAGLIAWLVAGGLAAW